jgi:CRISPR-associated protein Csm4
MATMPSDSLFAALIARMARTHGAEAVEKFCEPFVEGKPPFVLSSTFPFAGKVKFLPVPLLHGHDADEVGVQAKKLKHVNYVSEALFRRLLGGASLARLYDPKLTVQSGQLLLSSDDFKRLPAELQNEHASVWVIEQRPRVTLDRSTSASNLFHIGQVRFAARCGLWFAVRWLEKNAGLQKTFSGLIHELADAGFGAERAVGMGVAEVSHTDALNLPDVTGAWVTLSRYLPTEGEVNALADVRSAYSIRQVGGWLDSPVNMGQRRRAINLIEEGSVIGVKPQRVTPGRMEDVQPRYKAGDDVLEPLGHPVYRCGFALAVGLEGGAG